MVQVPQEDMESMNLVVGEEIDLDMEIDTEIVLGNVDTEIVLGNFDKDSVLGNLAVDKDIVLGNWVADKDIVSGNFDKDIVHKKVELD